MLTVVAIFLWVGLSACAQYHVQRGVDPRITGPSLDVWLEKTLIPYLVQQFGQHPRFKGRPVLLVDMQADNVQSRIDELTDQIREKIIDALLKEPGLDLSWRPAIQPWQHHQSLEDVSCGDYRNIHGHIGQVVVFCNDVIDLFFKADLFGHNQVTVWLVETGIEPNPVFPLAPVPLHGSIGHPGPGDQHQR